MPTTSTLLEQLIACGTPAHLVAAVARLEAELVWTLDQLRRADADLCEIDDERARLEAPQ